MAAKDWTQAPLSERVLHLCKLFDVGQNALGAKAGIESGPMSRLAHDKRTTSKRAPETLRKLADAWDVHVEWLAFGRGPVLRDATPAPTRATELDPTDPADRWQAAQATARGSRDDLERDGVTVEDGITQVEQHQAWSKLPDATALGMVRLIEDAIKTLAKARRGESIEKGRPVEDDELAAPRR